MLQCPAYPDTSEAAAGLPQPVTYFTPRERQIVRAIASGLRNRQIAAELGISEQTVKNQLGIIFRKLGIGGRVQLAVYGMQRGMHSA